MTQLDQSVDIHSSYEREVIASRFQHLAQLHYFSFAPLKPSYLLQSVLNHRYLHYRDHTAPFSSTSEPIALEAQ